MAGSVQMDRRAFDAALEGFERDTGLNAHVVLVDSMRSLLRVVVRKMPPKTSKVGKTSIRRDVNILLGALDNKPALDELDAQFGDRFFPLRFDSSSGADAVAEIERFRNSRGRVRARRQGPVKAGPYTFTGKRYVPRRTYNQIVRKKEAKVGLAKAGFRQAAKKFRLPLPRWIDRHASAPGMGRDTYRPGSEDYYLEAVNAVPHAQRHKGLVDGSMQKMIYNTVNKLDRQLARIAKKHSAK